MYKGISMKRILLACFAIMFGLTAQARDLPQGGFLLLGTVFSSPNDEFPQLILPHAQIEGDQIQWSFVTARPGDARSCKEDNKCKRVAVGPRHRVQWSNSGTLTVLGTERAPKLANAVISTALDEQHVFRALDNLLENANLKLTATGGSMSAKSGRRAAPRTITWHPLSLEETVTGLAFSSYFFADRFLRPDLAQCALKQFAQSANAPSPTPEQSDVLHAAQYYREIMDIQAQIIRYAGMPRNDLTDIFRPAEDLTLSRQRILRTILDEGKLLFPTPSDDDSADPTDLTPSSAIEILDGIHRYANNAKAERLNARSGGYLDHIVTTRPRQYLAAIQFEQRLQRLNAAGDDKMRAICADFTLSKY